MDHREVYKSTTMGEIPLSFTGRHLLQELREATIDMTDAAVKQAKAGQGPWAYAWEPVSRARAKIAKYMSELEVKSGRMKETMNQQFGPFPSRFSDTELLNELERRRKLSPERFAAAWHQLRRLDRACNGKNCGSTDPRYHSAQCFKEHEQTVSKCVAADTVELKVDCVRPPFTVHLPPIPEGYRLTMVGNLTTIEPVEPTQASGS